MDPTTRRWMQLVPILLLVVACLAGCARRGVGETGEQHPQPSTGTAEAGPACDDLVDSKDCPAGKRCCPLPPGQYEMPLCLPNCAGKPETFCKELLGGIAECNPEAGCCHFPKVLRR